MRKIYGFAGYTIILNEIYIRDAGDMDVRGWREQILSDKTKKAMPLLSFPGGRLIGANAGEMVKDGRLMARAMVEIAGRCDTLASVGMMDLSVEAEAFGAEIVFAENETPTVVGRLVKNMEDADALAVPPVISGRAPEYIGAIQLAKKNIVDKPVFGGVIGPFSLAGRLMDMTEIMITMYEEPELVHAVLIKCERFIAAYCAAFKRAGADGVIMAEPAAGLLSPDLADEFSSPYTRHICETVKDGTFAVIYHNCGRTAPLMRSILSVGADGCHFGNAADMAEILALTPKNVLAFGNIDPAGQFVNGTPDSVYAATTALVEKCKTYDNFVPSSGCDIPITAPWENIDAFFRAVKDMYG